MKFIRAKSICYGPVRPYENVTAIVIHYNLRKTQAQQIALI